MIQVSMSMRAVSAAEIAEEKAQRKAICDAEQDYEGFRDRLQARFLKNLDGPLFRTSAEDLFETFLNCLPWETRQHYQCHCCKDFFNRYGGLVTIGEDGLTRPAMWFYEDASNYFKDAVRAVFRLVTRAEVTGVFLSSEKVWGQPVTGEWTHFCLTPPKEIIYTSRLLTAGQAMAEKREDYRNVQRALAVFTRPMLDQAVTLLESEAMYRAEKVIGPARWLRDLHVARDAVRGYVRDNIVWRAITTAPAGYCHPRSSMVGTLLEDLAAGKDFKEVSRAFAAKMHPHKYQRPKEAPTAGNIARAEDIVAKLGIARSLERRFARLDEVEAIWRPTPPKTETKGGVFGHLRPKSETHTTVGTISPPATVITWEKFRRTVLPTAQAIEYRTKHSTDSYAALVTAVHADAPPILQWDLPERRNPVSWYFRSDGKLASQWGLGAGYYYPVTAVTLNPNQWGPDPDAFSQQGQGVMFLIQGAKDIRTQGNALFPETLKSELREVRSTIERYAATAKMEGLEEASACGILLHKGGKWDAQFRVWNGSMWLEYRMDRWD